MNILAECGKKLAAGSNRMNTHRMYCTLHVTSLPLRSQNSETCKHKAIVNDLLVMVTLLGMKKEGGLKRAVTMTSPSNMLRLRAGGNVLFCLRGLLPGVTRYYLNFPSTFPCQGSR